MFQKEVTILDGFHIAILSAAVGHHSLPSMTCETRAREQKVQVVQGIGGVAAECQI